MYIAEDYVIEKDNGVRFSSGYSGIYEPYTDNVRQLFDSLQREHGPCRGSVRLDTADSTLAYRVGWVFHKRKRYIGCHSCYTQETWVTLYNDKEGHAYKHI